VYANPLVNPGPADIQRIATEAGLDTAALDACLKSSRPRDALLSQLAEAQTGGVSGTPTLFVNGKRLPRLNDFTQTVDKEAARLGLPPLAGAQARH
jgi:2-hydroxychromene-2-carboxylate isomerase